MLLHFLDQNYLLKWFSHSDIPTTPQRSLLFVETQVVIPWFHWRVDRHILNGRPKRFDINAISTLFEKFVPIKTTRLRHTIITGSLLKHLKRFGTRHLIPLTKFEGPSLSNNFTRFKNRQMHFLLFRKTSVY